MSTIVAYISDNFRAMYNYYKKNAFSSSSHPLPPPLQKKILRIIFYLLEGGTKKYIFMWGTNYFLGVTKMPEATNFYVSLVYCVYVICKRENLFQRERCNECVNNMCVLLYCVCVCVRTYTKIFKSYWLNIM